VTSSPTVADGTVYIGSRDNSVYALDAADGSQQWSFATGDRVRSSPTVVGGTVYVGSNDNSVYAIEASSGSGAESKGSSRNLLGTLGHNEYFAGDGSLGITTLSGTVEDSAGNSIENATVYVFDDGDDSLVGTTTADTNGNWSFDTVASSVTVVASSGSPQFNFEQHSGVSV